MNLAFAGTPDFAATVLDGLLSSPHEVGLVISQPDPRRGRGRRTTATPVASLARSRGLTLVRPARISEVVQEISAHDALVVAAYGQILRADTLYAATRGAWNVHASLLPKYRGAAPVERAIMAGERASGVSIIRMDEGLDTGPVALRKTTPIPPDMTGGELTDALAQLGAQAIVESLGLLETDRLTLSEQDSLNATYASKLSDEDQVIAWDRGSGEVGDQVRALAPRIGARTFHPGYDGPVKIWRSRHLMDYEEETQPGRIHAGNGRIYVECGSGALEILELQVPGGRRVAAPDFLRGNTVGGAFLGPG